MAKKKKKSGEEMPDEATYATFDFKHGYVWGPAHKNPGSIPYWITGKPAVWSYVADGSPIGGPELAYHKVTILDRIKKCLRSLRELLQTK